MKGVFMANILFNNTSYKLLSYMYDRKLPNNQVYCTQDEIGSDMNLSRSTIHRLLTELREANYIAANGPHFGRYLITDVGIKMIETLRELEKL